MKTIRVREAKPRDLGLFRKLQGEFFDDPENSGAVAQNNSEFFDTLFHTLVESDDGFILFVAEKGMIVVGPVHTDAKLRFNKLGNIWTAVVSADSRDLGIEMALFVEAKKLAMDKGYDGLSFASPSVGTWSEVAEDSGFEPLMIHYLLELD